MSRIGNLPTRGQPSPERRSERDATAPFQTKWRGKWSIGFFNGKQPDNSFQKTFRTGHTCVSSKERKQ
jgi:hypothetical protein